jgi:hypothetical protein
VVVVADIGGGTSDFGAFMTGLPGRGVLAEVDKSSGIRRLAGDRLDELLMLHICNQARMVHWLRVSWMSARSSPSPLAEQSRTFLARPLLFAFKAWRIQRT